jgi:hypothetical protein
MHVLLYSRHYDNKTHYTFCILFLIYEKMSNCQRPQHVSLASASPNSCQMSVFVTNPMRILTLRYFDIFLFSLFPMIPVPPPTNQRWKWVRVSHPRRPVRAAPRRNAFARTGWARSSTGRDGTQLSLSTCHHHHYIHHPVLVTVWRFLGCFHRGHVERDMSRIVKWQCGISRVNQTPRRRMLVLLERTMNKTVSRSKRFFDGIETVRRCTFYGFCFTTFSIVAFPESRLPPFVWTTQHAAAQRCGDRVIGRWGWEQVPPTMNVIPTVRRVRTHYSFSYFLSREGMLTTMFRIAVI